MAKKVAVQAVEQALTANEVSKATAVFDAIAMAYGTAGKRFKDEIIPMYVLNGIVVLSLRKELTALNRQAFVTAWKARKGSDLDLAEVEQAKASANSSFSGFAGQFEPNRAAVKRGTKSTQTASNGAAANATDKAATTLPADSANAIPHVLMAQQQVKDVLASIAAVQTDLVAFQENVRVTKQGRELIGSIAEKIAGLHALASTLAATLL